MVEVAEVTDQTFETEGLKSDKPAIIDFWAEWCGPCRAIAPIIKDLAAEYGDRVKVVKMDIESSEYEVLRDLLDTGAAKHITHIFIEFHSEYFKEPESSHYRSLERGWIDELEALGVGVTVWI